MILHFKQATTQCMQTLFIIASFFLVTMPVVADDDNERYQAVVLNEGGQISPKVFIIDSRDGHMWILEQNTKLEASKGGFTLGSVLTYQGRVRPGKKMGEIVEQAETRR